MSRTTCRIAVQAPARCSDTPGSRCCSPTVQSSSILLPEMAPLTACCYSCRGTGPSLSSGALTRPSPAPDVQRVGRQPRCRSTHPTRPSRSGNPAALLRVTCPWVLCQRLDRLWCWPGRPDQARSRQLASGSSHALLGASQETCSVCVRPLCDLERRARDPRSSDSGYESQPRLCPVVNGGRFGPIAQGSAPAAGTRRSRR